MKLREHLRTRNAELLALVEGIVEKATPNLWHTIATFPTGTSHTPEHTQMVERIAGKLFSDSILSQLSPDEVATLILACHFHDLGMVGTEQDNLSEESRDQVRHEHAVSIGRRIRENWRTFGFQNEINAIALADVCRGHRPTKVEGEVTWDDLPRDQIVGEDRVVRIRLVAAMIYASDELHLGEERAPQREEEFLEVRNTESLLHWRRHQSISGPVLMGGQICFDAIVRTIPSQRDLIGTIQKAKNAIRHLNAQLTHEGIAGAVPILNIRWKRTDLWHLLIGQITSDLRPKSPHQIKEEVNGVYAESLGDLIAECPFDQNAESEIKRAIQDLKTDATLVSSGDRDLLSLSTKPRIVSKLLNFAKEADKLDLLFPSTESASYEHCIYQSACGRSFVQDHLLPKVDQDYGMGISSSPISEHLRTCIQHSPTAARVIQQISLPPSAMSHTDLLEYAVVAGICGDLINDPELILDSRFRQATNSLFQHAVERLPGFLLFAKELAIINKLEMDKLADVMVRKVDPEALPGGEPTTFTITQQYSAERKHWSLGNIHLASSRAGIDITILNSRFAPFQIKSSGEVGMNGILPTVEPISITIGYSAETPGTPVPRVAARASVSYNKDNGILQIVGERLSADDSSRCLLFIIKTNSKGEGGETKLIDVDMNVGDMVAILEYSKDKARNPLAVKCEIRLRGITKSENCNFKISDAGDDLLKAVTKLAAIDPGIPMPICLSSTLLKEIADAETQQSKQLIESFKAQGGNRPIITSVFARLAVNGHGEYHEEYLGMLPLGSSFNAPVCSDTELQEKIDLEWEIGEHELVISSYFAEESYELVESLRNWMNDLQSGFPFNLDGDGSKFHFANTFLTQKFHPIIDRLWYRHRRVTFCFRPVSKAQRYGIEMNYWREQGDEERASLLNELFQVEASREREAGFNLQTIMQDEPSK
jgi:hypothetical protein